MFIEPLESRIAPAALIVTNLHDSGPGSLRDAITQANAPHTGGPDTIAFAASVHGKIVLKTDLPAIVDDVTITGPGATKLTLDGSHKHQIFYLGDGENAHTISITGLTLKDGSAASGGAISASDPGGYVTIGDCVITGSRAVGLAGSDSYGLAKGGAIDFESGTLTITHSKLTGNSALGAAGDANGPGGDAQGGALYVGTDGAVSMDTTVVSGNIALGGKGLAGTKGQAGTVGQDGYYGYAGGYAGNAQGGAIFNAGALTIKTSTISGNSALGGHGGDGGAGGAGGKGNSTYAPGNGGDGGAGGVGGNAAGGGIANLSYLALNVSSSTISGNTAVAGSAGKVGAGGKAGPGVSHMSGSTYHGTAGAAGYAGSDGASVGGGIYSYAGTLSLSQVTIAKNTAGVGGGLNLTQNASTEIHNSTIAFNTALQDGGGIFVTLDDSSDSVNLISTIIAKNSAPSGAGQDITGSVSADHSLIQSMANVTVADFSTDLTGDPLLGTLANHGGLTDTILPSGHSLVINAGSNPDGLTSDQRDLSFPRMIGVGVDIGAVEAA